MKDGYQQGDQPAIQRAGKFILMGFLIVCAFVISWAGWVYFQAQQGKVSNHLFVQAERYYNQQNYQAALALYRQFSEDFPDNLSIELVQERIRNIEGLLTTEQDVKPEIGDNIQELLKNAIACYRQEKYIAPAENNAIYFTNRLLELDPGNIAALEIQGIIVNMYDQIAKKAMERREYARAANIYQLLLEINPFSPGLQEKLTLAQNRRQLNENSDLEAADGQPSQPLAHQQALRKNDADPAGALVSENLMFSETTGSVIDSLQTLVARENSSPIPIKNVENTTMPVLTAADGQQRAASQILGSGGEIPVLNELMIDSGRRIYAYQESIFIPADWEAATGQVQAQCIIGTDGIVESVDIVEAHNDKRINHLIVATLRNYRFEPATYRGQPIRYKVIETVKLADLQ